MSNFTTLASMGWQPFFQQQISLEEWESVFPARVVEQQKSNIIVSKEAETISLPLQHSFPSLVVGDWILLDEENRFLRLLERKTCFSRKAAGSESKKQLIASNVDVAFIVCSMNDDFNLNRIERFLALVYEAGATPVVLLSKCDLTDAPDGFVEQVQRLDSQLCVEAINCLNLESLSSVSSWIEQGTTIVLLGSSGVGKSTLLNTLLGEGSQKTEGIREDDSKGRHTTSSRSLFALENMGMVIDVPGMREIQLADCIDGLAETFNDIEQLAKTCRFKDCQHQSEPGCAVLKAIELDELDERRLINYIKLLKEEAINRASLAEKRKSDKALGKYYKRTLTESKKLKGR